ncbi:CG32440 [Drosophila busckii]|uniref:CG32440 n=1 Tax=Drosophila busckii TaxID=30019 RepID=A0A0M4ELB1_DROBS|nr:uncharacterized protein LOC108599393 isoform X2 [Drosophila busckii]ALC44210.1 CG32440 [Drosophila busckii]
MTTQFGMEKCGGEGSGAIGAALVLNTLESEMSLDLKPSPKQTCIPLHQRQRLVSSDTSVNSRKIDIDMPDKSWSVLYIGSKRDERFE